MLLVVFAVTLQILNAQVAAPETSYNPPPPHVVRLVQQDIMEIQAQTLVLHVIPLAVLVLLVPILTVLLVSQATSSSSLPPRRSLHLRLVLILTPPLTPASVTNFLN